MNKKIYIVAGLLALMVATTTLAYTSFSHKKEWKSWDGGFEAMIEKKAEILGLSVDELKTKMEELKSHKKAFEYEEITKEEMYQKIQEKIKLLVQEGKITQEEADEKLEMMTNGKTHKSHFYWK